MEEISIFSLVKPLHHPKMYTDEDIPSYLQRLAELNGYTSSQWLIKNCLPAYGSKTPSIKELQFLLLEEKEWTGYDVTNNFVNEVIAISANLKGSLSGLRYCPHCLEENNYYRAHWFLSTSIACLKHNVLLVDRCPSCAKKIRHRRSKIGYCQCGESLAFQYDYEPTEKVALLFQYFIETGGLINYTGEEHRFYHRQQFKTLKDRLRFIHLMFRWSPEGLQSQYVKKKKLSLNDLSVAVSSLSKLYTGLFKGKEIGVEYFRGLQSLPDECSLNGHDAFMRFYRTFYRYYSDDEMVYYKWIIEEYIRRYWQKPLNDRHSLFSEALKEEHAWIPFKKACNDYGINPSVMHRAISEGRIEAICEKQGNRYFRACYRPSIEAALDDLQGEISFSDALEILGVTKKQLYGLIKQGVFQNAIPPEDGKSQRWRFNQNALHSYLRQLFEKVESYKGKTISIADALRVIGNRVENALFKILKAILNAEIRVTTLYLKSVDIRGIALSQSDFDDWLSRNRVQHTSLLTIPDFAKEWGINQEFAYQLVNLGLLTYQIMDKTRFIAKSDLQLFEQTYILLAHYAKAKGDYSRTILTQLTQQQIYSVDHTWKRKLRQKVFFKQDIDLLENRLQ